MKQQYGIIANPVSGYNDIKQKKQALDEIQDILGPNCLLDGLETKSKEEFIKCAKNLAKKVKVLVIAGGDGSVFDVINSVNSNVIFSFLPFGKGNFLRYNLNMPKSVIESAKQIKNGKFRNVDLGECNKQKFLSGSLGFGGIFFKERLEYLRKGYFDLLACYLAGNKSYFKSYQRLNINITIDGKSFEIPNFLLMIISKTHSSALGFKLDPSTRLDDGYLNSYVTNTSYFGSLYGLITARLKKCQVGEFKKCKSIVVTSNKKIPFEIHGDPRKSDKEFKFKVLPKAIKMRY